MEKLQKYEKVEDILSLEIAQRMSYFQLKYFLIGKEPTNQSKMWQCIREIKARKEALESLDLEHESTKDQLSLLEIANQKLKIRKKDLIESSQPYDCGPVEIDEMIFINIEETEINIRQNERNKKAAISKMEQLEKRKMYTEQELVFFLETFKSLQDIEPLKNFDDLDAQKQYWGEKLSNKLNLKMLTGTQIDTEIIETIVALPDDVPIKQQALATLSAKKEQMLRQLEALKKVKGD